MNHSSPWPRQEESHPCDVIHGRANHRRRDGDKRWLDQQVNARCPNTWEMQPPCTAVSLDKYPMRMRSSRDELTVIDASVTALPVDGAQSRCQRQSRHTIRPRCLGSISLRWGRITKTSLNDMVTKIASSLLSNYRINR